MRNINKKQDNVINKRDHTLRDDRSWDYNCPFPLIGKGTYLPIETYHHPIIFYYFTRDKYGHFTLSNFKYYIFHSHDWIVVNQPKSFLLKKVDLRCCLGINYEESFLGFEEIWEFEFRSSVILVCVMFSTKKKSPYSLLVLP